MELNTAGYTGSGDKSKAAATANVFRNIIDVSSSNTYLVAIWSTHSELINHFWRYVKQDRFNCRFINVMIDKSKCASENYSIPVIESEIAKSLKDQNVFKFFGCWENIIHQSSSEVVNDFLSLGGEGEKWESSILGMLKKLALAYAGKNINDDEQSDIVKNAMFAFDSTFRDSLERNIENISEGDICFDSSGDGIEISAIAGINSKLLLCETNVTPKPGNVYKITDQVLLKHLTHEILDYDYMVQQFANEIEKSLSEICQNNKIHTDYKKDYEKYCKKVRKDIREDKACDTIICEVSPLCDYAQQKWACYRFIYGITVPAKYEKHIKNAPFIFRTPILRLNGNDVFITLNLRRIETISLDTEIQLGYLCTMRKDLISAIQHSFANHCSRPGLVSL